jgi:hypothetical protein
MAQTQGKIKDKRSADELRQDVELTRTQIDRTVGALERRIEPKTLMHRVREAVIYQVRHSDAGRTVRDNPVASVISAVGLTSAAGGLAWLFSQSTDGRAKTEEFKTKPSTSERAKEFVSKGKSKLGQWRQRAGNRFRQARQEQGEEQYEWAEMDEYMEPAPSEPRSEQMKHKARDVQHRAGEMTHRAEDKIKHAGREAMQSLRDHPLVTGLAAVASGAVLGSLFGPTKSEQRTIGQAGKEAASKAQETISRTAEKAGEAVGKGEEATKSAMDESRQTPPPATVIDTTEDVEVISEQQKEQQEGEEPPSQQAA